MLKTGSFQFCRRQKDALVGFLHLAFNPPLCTLCGTKIILGMISAFLVNLKLKFLCVILWKGWAFDNRLLLWPRKTSSFRTALCEEDKLDFFSFLSAISQHVCGECWGTQGKWLWCWSRQGWGALLTFPSACNICMHVYPFHWLGNAISGFN